MSLTGFAHAFVSKFPFFSGFGYLSVYLCLWFKIWFFAGIGFLQIVREICLAIFWSCVKAFRSIEGFICGLEQYWSFLNENIIIGLGPAKFNIEFMLVYGQKGLEMGLQLCFREVRRWRLSVA